MTVSHPEMISAFPETRCSKTLRGHETNWKSKRVMESLVGPDGGTRTAKANMHVNKCQHTRRATMEGVRGSTAVLLKSTHNEGDSTCLWPPRPPGQNQELKTGLQFQLLHLHNVWLAASHAADVFFEDRWMETMGSSSRGEGEEEDSGSVTPQEGRTTKAGGTISRTLFTTCGTNKYVFKLDTEQNKRQSFFKWLQNSFRLKSSFDEKQSSCTFSS